MSNAEWGHSTLLDGKPSSPAGDALPAASTCGCWAAHLHSDCMGAARSWTSQDGSMLVDMAGGCWRALPARFCLQIDACGRDLGRVQRSAGGGRLGVAVDCCVSSSERRNPADFQGKKRLTGVLFFFPGNTAMAHGTQDHCQHDRIIGFVCHWAKQEG